MLDLVDVMSFAGSYALIEAASHQLGDGRFDDDEIAAACSLPEQERDRLAQGLVEVADRIRRELEHLDFRVIQLRGVIEIPSE